MPSHSTPKISAMKSATYPCTIAPGRRPTWNAAQPGEFVVSVDIPRRPTRVGGPAARELPSPVGRNQSWRVPPIQSPVLERLGHVVTTPTRSSRDAGMPCAHERVGGLTGQNSPAFGIRNAGLHDLIMAVPPGVRIDNLPRNVDCVAWARQTFELHVVVASEWPRSSPAT